MFLDDEIEDTFEEDEAPEVEPLGRTYVARADQHDQRYMSRRSLLRRAVANSDRSSSASLAPAASAGFSASSASGNSQQQPIASELALNRTLMDYVHQLRRLRHIDEDELRLNFHADHEAMQDGVQQLLQQQSIPDMRRPSEFASIVEQIRSIGAVHDTELSQPEVATAATAVASATDDNNDNDNNNSRQRYLSPLDLDGFYSSRMRILRNAYANADSEHQRQQQHSHSHGYSRNYNFNHISFSPEQNDEHDDNSDDAVDDSEIGDMLRRFEVLDNRIDLIRMARRELRMMEFETNVGLDEMRFTA